MLYKSFQGKRQEIRSGGREPGAGGRDQTGGAESPKLPSSDEEGQERSELGGRSEKIRVTVLYIFALRALRTFLFFLPPLY
jgi:hypothetical protein